MGVKFAASFGAEATVLSSSRSKEADAKRLGAHRFALTSDQKEMASLTKYFNFVLDAVSAPHDCETYLKTLKTDSVLLIVGLPTAPMSIPAFSLVPARRGIFGSMIGVSQKPRRCSITVANITSSAMSR